MNIESINMWLTIVSIICTIVSIVFSIISICNAKRARNYKEQAKQVLSLMDLKEILVEFERVSKDFINKTRDKDWYKGQDPNNIIQPLSDILIKFNSLYPSIVNHATLKEKVRLLSEKILNYEKTTPKMKKETNNIIYDIMELLNNSINGVLKDI